MAGHILYIMAIVLPNKILHHRRDSFANTKSLLVDSDLKLCHDEIIIPDGHEAEKLPTRPIPAH